MLGFYGMATLMDRRVRTSRTVSVTADHARALGDPIRSKIISMLYGKTLSAEEITEAVQKEGVDKAPTTVRHHIDVLRTSGLIEVTRIVESRGGLTKYYGTTTRLLHFEEPANFESAYSSVIDKTAKRLDEILGGVFSDVSVSGGKPTAEYTAYLVVEIMNRAITKVLEKGKRRTSRKKSEPSKKAATRGRTQSHAKQNVSADDDNSGHAIGKKTGNG